MSMEAESIISAVDGEEEKLDRAINKGPNWHKDVASEKILGLLLDTQGTKGTEITSGYLHSTSEKIVEGRKLFCGQSVV